MTAILPIKVNLLFPQLFKISSTLMNLFFVIQLLTFFIINTEPNTENFNPSIRPF